MIAADTMQNPMIATDQQMPIPTMLFWKPSTMRPSANRIAPARIHGRRRPSFEVVRSDRNPVRG